MRKLDVSAITESVAMPVKAGVFEHLQSAYQEALAELAKCFFGANYDSSKAYILNGLVNTGQGNDFEITAGAVFYNGEIYLVDAAAFATAGEEVAVCTIDVSFYVNGNRADPVQFAGDGEQRNIHQIRKIKIASGLPGSGVANFSALRFGKAGAVPVGAQMFYKGSYDDFDNTGLGITENLRGWAIRNGQNNTDDDRGLVTAGHLPNDAKFGALYGEVGTVSNTLTMANLPADGASVDVLRGNQFAGASNNTAVLDVDTVLAPFAAGQTVKAVKTKNLGQGTAIGNIQPTRMSIPIERIF